AVAEVPCERDQGEVAAVQHDLERKQHDQRIASQQDAERPGGEQEGRDTEVPRDLRAHQRDHSDGTSSGASRRECAPRMTPPTAATSSTIDVISNASRWSVRNSRPICAGLPKAAPTCSECASCPLAFSPTTT